MTKKMARPQTTEELRRNVADVERFLADNPHLKEELARGLLARAREVARSSGSGRRLNAGGGSARLCPTAPTSR